MAFAKGLFLTILITLTYCFIVILFIYRFIIAYRPVRNEIKLSKIPFFYLPLRLRNSTPFADLQGVIDFCGKKLLTLQIHT